MKESKYITILFIFILIGYFTSINFVFASNTNGTIDDSHKYAWGENTGWINFGTPNGNVLVTDSNLSGYALSENFGWINLDNIVNDGEGNLSGFAWSENTGWIKFNPENGGVIIDEEGYFTGSALSETIGWIVFDGDRNVRTDWRPRTARPACNNMTDDDSDSSIDFPNDPGCESLNDDDEADPVRRSFGSYLLKVISDVTPFNQEEEKVTEEVNKEESLDTREDTQSSIKSSVVDSMASIGEFFLKGDNSIDKRMEPEINESTFIEEVVESGAEVLDEPILDLEWYQKFNWKFWILIILIVLSYIYYRNKQKRKKAPISTKFRRYSI